MKKAGSRRSEAPAGGFPTPSIVPAPAASRRPPAGFTLLEVLFAMGMVSIVAVSLFASLGTAYRAREHARAAMDPVHAVHVALEMAGEDLRGALPPAGILAGSFLGVRGTEGAGLADALEFYRVAPLSPAADRLRRSGGVEKVELSLGLLAGDPLPVLLRKRTANLLSPRTEEPEAEVLCRHVTSFGARYFDGTEWQEGWDSTTRENVLPGAVQLYLKVEWPARRSGAPTVYEATGIFVPSCAPPLSTGTSSGTGTGS